MQDYWGYRLCHFPNRFSSKYLRVFDYFWKFVLSLGELLRMRPDVVWIQVPPSMLLHLAFFYKLIAFRRVRVVVDLHNSMLRPFWMDFPLSKWLLNRADVVLAHNAVVYDELIAIGISNDVIRVLEDKPCSFLVPGISRPSVEPYALIPCSFDVDEPIEVVVEAARLLPDIKFFVTGKYEGKILLSSLGVIPENLVFCGYLSKIDFENLLSFADAVVGLTTRDNVQLSVANEALSVQRPMVLSDTSVLRDLYGSAARFVQNGDASALAEGIKDVVQHSDLYVDKVSKLLLSRNKRWLQQANLVRGIIE
jgi:glycosyltransferase involved in cell wall biosynthesis